MSDTFLRLVFAPGRFVHYLTAMAACKVLLRKSVYVWQWWMYAGADVENNVTVAYTSDKGLCGGINSTVTKYTRGVLRATEGG